MKPDHGKQQPAPLFQGINLAASRVQDFSGALVRLRFADAVSNDDAFIFVASDQLSIKKDEIKAVGGVGGGCIARLIQGKILPAANVSSKEVLILITAQESGTAAVVTPQSVEALISCLHFTNVGNPANSGPISPTRRVVELTIMLPKKYGFQQTTITSDVLISGIPTMLVQWKNETDGRLVVFCDNKTPTTPESLRQVITTDQVALFPYMSIELVQAQQNQGKTNDGDV